MPKYIMEEKLALLKKFPMTRKILNTARTEK